LEILCKVGDLQGARILDFGCGTGVLLEHLRALGFSGEYIGYDLAPEVVQVARNKFPGVCFEVRDILADGVLESFDYILISGVFNNRIVDNWAMFTGVLKCLFPHARRALAFNALSTYVDYFDPMLYYFSPESVFRFCKEQLSPLVTLHHDYEVRLGVVPYEFTVYIYSSPITPRAELRA
jgi:SAM-dependent methyltransferase